MAVKKVCDEKVPTEIEDQLPKMEDQHFQIRLNQYSNKA